MSTGPVNVSAEELRPVIREVDASEPANPDVEPVQTSAQELKPKITDVGEV